MIHYRRLFHNIVTSPRQLSPPYPRVVRVGRQRALVARDVGRALGGALASATMRRFQKPMVYQENASLIGVISEYTAHLYGYCCILMRYNRVVLYATILCLKRYIKGALK